MRAARYALLLALAGPPAGCIEFNPECSPPIEDPDVAVTYLADPIPVDRPTVRTRENALGDAMADAYLAALSAGQGEKPTIAIENSGAIRDQGMCIARTALGRGPLTRRVLKDVVPFNNKLVTVRLSEAELFDVLEHAVAVVGVPGATPAGQFLQVGGFSFDVDCAKPPEKLANSAAGVTVDQPDRRVQEIRLGGRAITRETASQGQTIVVALNDFLAGGGDNFLTFKGKTATPSNPERLTFNALVEHLQSFGASADQPLSLAVSSAAPRIVLRNCE